MDAMRTGAYLAMLRKAKGATQQEIAGRLGVSNKTVSKWESGGGLPDITVLPALAELYGVTADDILAGETLTDRRRSALEGETAAQRQRLLARLRMRFDVCFVISLALAGISFLRIQYVSLAAMPLSVAAGWVGYILVAHPIYYGGVKAETALWQNLYRKLLAAAVAWWGMLLYHVHLGSLDPSRIGFSEPAGQLILYYTYDHWRPLLFCVGLLLSYVLLQWGLRCAAGTEAALLPGRWKLCMIWFIWAVLFAAAWFLADGAYRETLDLWLDKYPSWEWIGRHAALRQRRDETFAPLLRARGIVLAAGGVSGLGLLGWTVWRRLRRKKCGILLQTHKNDDKISP